jgi:hypothetical protein
VSALVDDAMFAPAFAVESTDCSGIRHPEANADPATKSDARANTEIFFFIPLLPSVKKLLKSAKRNGRRLIPSIVKIFVKNFPHGTPPPTTDITFYVQVNPDNEVHYRRVTFACNI